MDNNSLLSVNVLAVKGFINRPLYEDYDNLSPCEYVNGSDVISSIDTTGYTCSSRAKRSVHTVSQSTNPLFVSVLVLMFTAIIASTLLLQTAIAHEQPTNLFETVTVMPGETVWEICEAHPVLGVSTYEMVKKVLALNEKSDATIVPGERLLLPIVNY